MSERDLELTDRSLREAAERGVFHLTLDDVPIDGRTISIQGRRYVHFGSCGYLGLELDERVKRGAIEATRRYGAFLSTSRGYLSTPQYEELEGLFDRIFDAHTLVAPTTTLAHMSALPLLVGSEDCVLLDRQVHASVGMAASQLSAAGIPVETVPHSQLDVLEGRVRELRSRHRRVWYMSDGVYSMYGDFAPVKDLVDLLERCPELHIYFDDAHGMSWLGPHGRGHVLDEQPIHERMVVATSLAKGFGACGGVLAFPDAETRRRVRTCGGPMVFSGHIAPPVLGAALASARIHLSPEIGSRQEALQRRIAFCNDLIREHDLPLVGSPGVPIRYIGVGPAELSYKMVARLMQAGFFTNVGIFPAVSVRRSGVRFTLTHHHRFEDIRGLVDAISELLPIAAREEGVSLDEIREAFHLPVGSGRGARSAFVPARAVTSGGSSASAIRDRGDRSRLSSEG